MPLRHFLLSVLLLAAMPACGQKKLLASHQVTAAAFYNFENFFDTLHAPKKEDKEFTPTGKYHYTSAIYHAKVHNMATVLQQMATDLMPDGPAIIGAAEIENDQVLQDLVAQPEISARGYRFIHFESPDIRGIDVALLYNPKYFTVLRAEALPVDISALRQKRGHTRDVLHVIGLLGSDTAHVFVNHWPSRLGGEEASEPLRQIAAAVNKQIIDSLLALNPTTRILEMGDLNDDPVDSSVAAILGAKSKRSQVHSGQLYNPWVQIFQHGMGTLCYRGGWNLFDQIILSSGWLKASGRHWRYWKSAVFHPDFITQKTGKETGCPLRSFEGTRWMNGYSDHFPVLVYFGWGE